MQKYRIVKTMGDGSFGIVFKAVSSHNQIVAIKKFKQKYTSWEQCLELREIKSLKKLDHPNMVKLKEVILSNNELYLVFDFIETNLYQMYMRAGESKRTLTENEIRSIFYQMTSGLAYLHRNGFFHRDLKPQNVLCHNNQLKLCDFGLAREIRSKPPYTDYVSTRWYRAPELLLRSTNYNSPVDIFALACIVIELYSMKPLFPGESDIDNMNKVVELMGTPKKEEWPEGYKLASKLHYNFPEKKKKQLYDLIPDASVEAVDLLEQMLSYNSKKRPSAMQILKHQYFEGAKLSNVENPIGNHKEDEKNQTKFSFYDKNEEIISIPKNIKVENPVEMEMRRSMIKFGNSFTSSFQLTKKADEFKNRDGGFAKPKNNKNQPSEEDDIFKQFENSIKTPAKQSSHDKKYENSPKIPNSSVSRANQNSKKDEVKEKDEMDKKFDEMEEILMELQEKTSKKEEKKDRRHYDQMGNTYDLEKNMQTPSQRKISQNSETQNQKSNSKIPGFVFGGLNGIASSSNLKNLINKYPQQSGSKY